MRLRGLKRENNHHVSTALAALIRHPFFSYRLCAAVADPSCRLLLPTRGAGCFLNRPPDIAVWKRGTNILTPPRLSRQRGRHRERLGGHFLISSHTPGKVSLAGVRDTSPCWKCEDQLQGRGEALTR
jgi:hypothetical protein